MKSFEFLKPDSSLWNNICKELKSDFYQMAEFNKLEAKRIDGHAEAFFIKDDKKQFLAAYIVRKIPNNTGFFDITSAYGYPWPLCSPEAQNDPNFCTEAIKLWCEELKKRKFLSIFLRSHSFIDINQEVWKQFGCLVNHGETVIIDLSLDESELWRQTKKRHRSEINKLKKDNSITFSNDFKYFDDFIQIYYETMDKCAADDLYYFKKDYFYDFKKALGIGLNLYSVLKEDIVICSGLFSEFNGICQYHLSATKNDYAKLAPTKYMLHEVTKSLKTKKNKYLNLGGGVGAGKDHLFLFKSGFSEKRAPFYTFRSIINEEKYKEICSTTEVEGFFPLYRRPINN